MDWLVKMVPGFQELDNNERNAIIEFTFLWTLFENALLGNYASTERICNFVESWQKVGDLDETQFSNQLAYFRDRYFKKPEFTHYFDGLNLRANDRPEMVKSVLNGENQDAVVTVSTILIIIYRFRNNLFHGAKWQDQLRDQFENFSNANYILKKILVQKGNLGAD